MRIDAAQMHGVCDTTGSWRRGDSVRQRGCRDRRCKALVLLMPDDGAP
ncbi:MULTISPECIES: hypothetical protein [unclassified Lysobacter]|nr:MULTISPECIES: hypothetical protein [unclassified Lysobacter]MBT2747029.1 hypothetical protein [Lysobacter sp. ISL-42]MBT2750510.1 hypothetical protein [Lysobacter sp. ISL-50]MBT2776356.1 hypothetical protein [Lysobacter sp. ISL-54]MBT2780851.1 hypothetical protein [Lysobacter sp. ISL-52]